MELDMITEETLVGGMRDRLPDGRAPSSLATLGSRSRAISLRADCGTAKAVPFRKTVAAIGISRFARDVGKTSNAGRVCDGHSKKRRGKPRLYTWNLDCAYA